MENYSFQIKGQNISFNRKPLSVLNNKFYFIPNNHLLNKCNNFLYSHKFKAFLITKVPFLYESLRHILYPVLIISGKNRSYFLKKYAKKNDIIINIASGNNTEDNFINIDIQALKKVDIISNADDIPISDSTADIIICETSLEHIENPIIAINEIYRILKPQGFLFITVPFMIGYHDHPIDYWRWTKQGLIKTLSNFTIIEIGNKGGIFSSFGWLFAELTATVFSFGNKTLHFIFFHITLFIIIPLKLLDFIFVKFPTTSNISSMFYAIVKKE